jgi:MHS family proline/betaine transporter-like MFS transporter
VLAVGYLARPLGGFIFSHYSDKLGRIYTFNYSILLMGISTFLIGCLPGYAQIGIWAPALFITFRILQGMSFGGEFSAAMVYVAEQYNKRGAGKSCSFLLSLTNFGFVLSGLLISLGIHFFGMQKIADYLWRVPFLIGGLVALSGVYLRKQLQESTVFNELQHQSATTKFPLQYLFQFHRREVFIGFIFGAIIAINGTLFYAYLPTYLAHEFHYPFEKVAFISSMTIVVLSFFSLVVAHLVDKYELRKIFLGCSILSILITYPLFTLFKFANLTHLIFAYGLICVVSMNQMLAFIFLVRLYPAQVRVSGFSFCYNMASALFSGSVPLVCAYLISLTDNICAPAFYAITTSLAGLVAMGLISRSLERHPAACP